MFEKISEGEWIPNSSSILSYTFSDNLNAQFRVENGQIFEKCEVFLLKKSLPHLNDFDGQNLWNKVKWLHKGALRPLNEPLKIWDFVERLIENSRLQVLSSISSQLSKQRKQVVLETKIHVEEKTTSKEAIELPNFLFVMIYFWYCLSVGKPVQKNVSLTDTTFF